MRNVVLVTVDSLRADHCGFMGYERDTTPTLDRMASGGLSFTNAVSPGPSTPESMPVIMTGEFPLEAERDGASLLAERRATINRHLRTRETIAERFSRAGYDTAAFSPNPYTSRYFGFDGGFDRFEDFLSGSRDRLYRGLLDGVFSGTSMDSVLPVRILLNWLQREEVFKPWEAFYDELLAWTRNATEPYFVWVLLMDTHDPYLVPSEYRTQSRRAMYHSNYRLWRQGHEPPFSASVHDRLVRAYDDTVSYADAFLDRLRTDLRADDPVIAVHGDHGEAFGEHGTYGHHQQLYEENIHVPFVVDGLRAAEIERPVTLQQLPELLSSAATHGTLPSRNRIVMPSRTLDEERLALRARRWKYLRNGTSSQLFDLSGLEREELEHDELRETAERLAAHHDEGRGERARIAAASTQVVSARL